MSGRRLGEWLRVSRLFGTVCLVTAGLAGCSFSLAKVDEEDDLATGSIAVRPPLPARLPGDLGQEDLRRATGALALALDPQGNGRSVKWDNPETHLSGEFVPNGGPFVQNDEVCRHFTTAIRRPNAPGSDLAGTACKLFADEWQITKIAKAGRR